MDENLEQGTNNNTDSANGGTPQNTNTQDQQSMILGGGGDTNTDQPAEPIVYDFSTAFEGGEVDQTIADEFSKMLNGVGATQEQALQMAKFGNQYATNLVTAYENQKQEALKAQYDGYAENAKKVLGSKFDTTVSQAAAGVEAVEKTIPNIREILAENGLGNRVEVIQLFAHIAGMASEDNNAGNGQGGSTYISEEERAKMLYPSMK
ncbi:MAG: hypothetical protein E6275_06825 [Veillonella sp.]|uniref:hypothetical protein n=1 Tax=Veillonella sp. TaxID=1926307 RepID=UPI00290C1D5B|nr:hypothetical protein [Veillonella sp.]MDU7211835.1 hypothetical protein [Veillonella sp.]